MLRLGTRPERKRTSVPPEASASSFSPLTVLMLTGTSWMFSTRRCAVTSTVSSVAARTCAVSAGASAGASVAGVACCAAAASGNSAATRARASGRAVARKDRAGMAIPRGMGQRMLRCRIVADR